MLQFKQRLRCISGLYINDVRKNFLMSEMKQFFKTIWLHYVREP